MTIERLDHVNLRTENLQEMIDWYATVLGLRDGERPDFPFPGAWLYAGDHAVVHLVGLEGHPGAGSETPLRLEHFALAATGRAEFEQRLKDRGQRYEVAEIADFGITQINVWDPDGNHLHVDFGREDI